MSNKEREKILIMTTGRRELQLKDINVQPDCKGWTKEFLDEARNGIYYLNPRFGGAFLAKKKDQFSLFTMPIIEPVLDYFKIHKIKLDKIYLVTTDQGEETTEQHRRSDTSPLFPVLRECITRYYKSPGTQCAELIVIRNSANLMDSVYVELTSNKNLRKKIWQSKAVFLCTQGGMPPINSALLLYLLQHFGSITKVLSVDEQLGLARDLHINEQILNERTQRSFQDLISKYYYVAASKLEGLPKEMKLLCEYAAARLQFDFALSKQKIDQLDLEWRPTQDRELNSLVPLLKGEEHALLFELFQNARIKYSQGSFVDFLLRLFRLREGLILLFLQEYLPFGIEHKKWKRDIRELLDSDQMKDFGHVEEYGVYVLQRAGQSASVELERANTFTYMKFLEFFENRDNKTRYVFLKDIEELSGLRNNSIGAHNFASVSKVEIDSRLAKRNLSIDDLWSFFEIQLGTQKPYDEFNRALIGLSKRS